MGDLLIRSWCRLRRAQYTAGHQSWNDLPSGFVDIPHLLDILGHYAFDSTIRHHLLWDGILGLQSKHSIHITQVPVC